MLIGMMLIGIVTAYTAPTFNDIDLVLENDYTAPTFNDINLVLGGVLPEIHLISPVNETSTEDTIITFSSNITTLEGISNLALYIWNSTGDSIVGYDRVGFDTSGSGNSKLHGIATDETYFWLTDDDNNKIYTYWVNGTSIDNFGTTGANSKPWGITYYDGFLWVTDFSVSSPVYQYWTNGTYITSFSLHASNGAPTGIAYYGGYFWVIDEFDELVYKYNTSWVFQTTFQISETETPSGMAYYNGSFWITDATDDRVYKYLTDGTYTGNYFDTPETGGFMGIEYYNGSFWITDDVGDEVDVYYTLASTKQLSGTSNSTTWDYNFSDTGNYLWNTYGCDTSGSCAWSEEGNFSLEITLSEFCWAEIPGKVAVPPGCQYNININDFFIGT